MLRTCCVHGTRLLDHSSPPACALFTTGSLPCHSACQDTQLFGFLSCHTGSVACCTAKMAPALSHSMHVCALA